MQEQNNCKGEAHAPGVRSRRQLASTRLDRSATPRPAVTYQLHTVINSRLAWKDRQMAQRTRRHSFRVLVATAAVVGALSSFAMPSHAMPSRAAAWECDHGWFCAYDGPHGTQRLTAIYPSACGQIVNIGLEGKGDKMSSYWNRSDRAIWFLNWTGSTWDTLFVTGKYGHQYTVPSHADNKIDAIQLHCIP
ncbi:peptidase inhibitor family I36 protein [Streptomyces pseudogriseolus]|uniref:peptidase inhibitor family I36 protein n=1 Tax=Streptomyces pseudogriseolus TaxID=36817 RepID=UPI003FA1F267